jgi:hypothetical protein
MTNMKKMFLLFLIITFLAGILVILTSKTKIENLENEKKDDSCPDLLVQKGNKLMLFNSKKPVDDNNPIPFANLDEYIYYLEIERKKGNNCPVLYLQQENNAQGQDVYRIRPSPFDKQGGVQQIPPTLYGMSTPLFTKTPVEFVDASREHKPYNTNNYSGFDPYNLYTGIYTNLDAIHDSTKKAPISDNPADPNWGGTEFTHKSIISGKYDENNIYKPMLYQPKMAFLPIENKDLGHPKDVY